MNTKTKTINVNDYNKSNVILRGVAIGVIILVVFLSFPSYCNGHSHEHDEHDHHHHHDVEEPANFKWTREANEAYVDEHHSHEGHAHHSHDHHTKGEKTIKTPRKQGLS